MCRPDQETCWDGLDNDCDGDTDEGCGEPCPAGDCLSPPDRRCLDDTRLEYYEVPGVCVDGLCRYERLEAACPQGCEGGACAGDACLGLSCPDDGNPCTDEGCDPTSGCTREENTGPCEDGDLCSGPDTCRDGICVVGPPVDCDDGISCTGDVCRPELGCVNTPVDLACDDFDDCTDNLCSAETGCYYPPSREPCDDGDPCTMTDICGEGGCRGVPLDADGDGFIASSCGGDDCGDEDVEVNPAEEEVCDEKDNDCDGLTDLVGTGLCDYEAICQRGSLRPCENGPGPTVVPGVMDVDTVWCARGSPYVVEQGLAIMDGSRLTVGPCLEVRMGAGALIEARGDFEVRANPAYPAVFQSSLVSPQRGSWEGITCRKESDYYYFFLGAVIRHAVRGIYFPGLSRGLATINDTRFEANSTGVYGSFEGRLESERLVFEGNGCGIEGASHVLTECSFVGNDYGVCEAQVFQVFDSTFYGNAVGFRGFLGLLENCVFEENGQAVTPSQYLGTTTDVSRCTLVNNGSGITVGPNGMHFVVDSILCDNGAYDIQNQGFRDVDATHNWWCTTDPGEIAARIYDLYDDASLGRVTFEPFLTEEP